jgi:hypothetical protein
MRPRHDGRKGPQEDIPGLLGARRFEDVSRSYKDDDPQRFVKLCFAAADPNVGSGSIKKAIEAYIRLNPRHRTARAPITKKAHLMGFSVTAS